jgi:hypothetical protein
LGEDPRRIVEENIDTGDFLHTANTIP